MSCPKDADPKLIHKNMCGEYNIGFCTRPKGHKGSHHAHGIHCIKAWKQ